MVLVEFWTAWCPDCQQEEKLRERIKQEYCENGGIVLAIGGSQKSNPTMAKGRRIGFEQPYRPARAAIDTGVLFRFQGMRFRSSAAKTEQPAHLS